MCRLYGFRSSVPARVHRSLVLEKNSLVAQSHEHKDGWGIAFYADSEYPDVVHGLGAAHEDPEFARMSGLVHSHAVIAHVRLASVGPVAKYNAHPFVHGRWSFAHNGTLREFLERDHKSEVERRIAPKYRAKVHGDTDSERCFYLFLTYLDEVSTGRSATPREVARALARVMREVSALTDRPEVKPSSMNFLVTDGELMVATRRNRTLFFSEHKKKGQDPAEPPRDGTRLSQIVIASEELSFEDHWHEIPEDGIIGVDRDMVLRHWKVNDLLA
jgi:glutamine amidotransferase